ncbi:MAG: YqeG family HAD IIIA-type phosphatase [Eubacterium sp.]|nr:YqeG family HAD IIIA-type phosphatase [Eubacterium sp.]
MLNLLYPKEYLEDIKDIDPKKLKALGIDAVIFDIDNTLVPYFIKTPTEKVLKLFKRLEGAGLKITVLSNSKPQRSEAFLSGLNIPFEARAKKPLSKGLKILLKKTGLKPSQCAIVGDQIFTDVLLGNLNGVYSILVKQADKKDELITAVKRPLEKIVLFFYGRSLRREKKC